MRHVLQICSAVGEAVEKDGGRVSALPDMTSDLRQIVSSYQLAGPSSLILKLPPNIFPPLFRGNAQSINKEQFVNLISELSEPDPNQGETEYWYPNFISNEAYQCDVAEILQPMGGIYLGTGPYQNYSYIIKTQPELAFIIDIRRDNLLQLMMSRALMEMSETRVEYLSKLLLRKTPDIAACGASLSCMLDAIEKSPSLEDPEQLLKEVFSVITQKIGIDLSDRDKARIEAHFLEFSECGFMNSWRGCNNPTSPSIEDLSFKIGSYRGKPINDPAWRDLILHCGDNAPTAHWLGSEENYRYIRKMHMENRIIPVVGDFAGRHTFQALGEKLKTWGQKVSVFYVSNVELYLRGEDTNRRFRQNVASLPLADDSILIRAMEPEEGLEPEAVVGSQHDIKFRTYRMTIQKIRPWLKFPVR